MAGDDTPPCARTDCYGAGGIIPWGVGTPRGQLALAPLSRPPAGGGGGLDGDKTPRRRRSATGLCGALPLDEPLLAESARLLGAATLATSAARTLLLVVGARPPSPGPLLVMLDRSCDSFFLVVLFRLVLEWSILR